MYEIMKNIPALKTCPFCKGPGLILKSSIMPGYPENNQYQAGCFNKDCKIQPRTRKWDDIYRTADKAINNAAENWNYRKD